MHEHMRYRHPFIKLQGAPLIVLGALLVGSLCSGPAQAQPKGKDTNALVSGDNPGLINVTSPAPKLTLVTEVSASAAFPDERVEVVLPGLLARLGLLDWLEVRAYVPSLVLTFPDVGDTQADADELGLGAVVSAQISNDVSASIVPVIVLPVVDDEAGAAEVEGHVQGNVSWDMTEKWSLAAALRTGWKQVRVLPGALSTEVIFRGGVLGQYSPVEKLALFVQSYAEFVTGSEVEPVVGGGLSYWVVPSVALFAEANSGLTDDSPPVQTTAGAVVRWW